MLQAIQPSAIVVYFTVSAYLWPHLSPILKHESRRRRCVFVRTGRCGSFEFTVAF